MLNCKQTSLLVSQSLDRKLNWRERMAVRLHLWICVYCRRFMQQLLAMRVALKRLSQEIEDDENIRMSSETKAWIAHHIDTHRP